VAESAGPGGFGDKLSNLFRAPDLHARVLASPKTAPYMAQPDFVAKLNELRADPSQLQKHVLRRPPPTACRARGC
jgi:hypothetical protein